MPGEDKELAGEKGNPMAEDELPTIVKKATVPKLLGQQKNGIALDVAGHISEEEGMAEVEELTISATGATSGGTDLLNVLKQNKLIKEERLLHNQRK